MSEGTQVDNDAVVATALAAPSTVLLDRLARIRAIRAQLTLLKREYRLLTAGQDLRQLQSPVQCLRCGYEWIPNNPFSPPATCARCGTTAWDKPPLPGGRSRKPGDPPRPWWHGRRQSRKGPPKATLRFRIPEVDLPKRSKRKQAELKEATRVPFSDLVVPIMSPPPATSDDAAPMFIPPPPDPRWEGSLAAHLRGERDEPQPEIVSSHLAETPIMTEPELALAAPAASVLEEITIAEDVPPESVGAPETDAEREELTRAKEEAWPTTRSDD
jgi:predicted Zn-ribbon and HTH transcriptional regulator